MKTDKSTPRPWHNLCDKDIGENGSRIQDLDGRTIASTNYRSYDTDFANAALIVEAVNNYDRLRAIEQAARHEHAPENTQGENHLNCSVCEALAANPEQARQQAQRQREYVQALERVAEVASIVSHLPTHPVTTPGGNIASVLELKESIDKLEAVRKEKK